MQITVIKHSSYNIPLVDCVTVVIIPRYQGNNISFVNDFVIIVNICTHWLPEAFDFLDRFTCIAVVNMLTLCLKVMETITKIKSSQTNHGNINPVRRAQRCG